LDPVRIFLLALVEDFPTWIRPAIEEKELKRRKRILTQRTQEGKGDKKAQRKERIEK